MTNRMLVAAVLAAVAGGTVSAETIEIKDAPFAMPAIVVPEFPARDFPITAFGAKADGSKCTEAIDAAMAACAKAGGGRVVVPAGTWLTGAVRFRSGCNLHLAEGAVLESTDDPADYPEVHTTWEGVECLNYSPLFFAYGCTNVAITGKGTIAPRMDFWRTWFKRPPEHMAATERLYHWCSTNAPMSARSLLKLPKSHMRPHLIQMNRCGNVLLDGFRIRESPFWMIHLYHSENCVVRNLDTYAHGHNNDGVDVDMTQNVLIENCHFDQGDDGVVLKAGRNLDAWRLDRPTQNVVVRDCNMVKSHSLLGIGSELSGGVRNVWMTRCRVADTYSMLRIKTGRRRGGFVENVWIDHCTGKQMIRVFNIFTDYCAQWGKFPDYELRYTRIRNINVSDLVAECADVAVELHGAEQLPAERIRVRNVKVGRVTRALTDVYNCLDVQIDGLELTAPDRTPRHRSLRAWADGTTLTAGVRRELKSVTESLGLRLELASAPAGCDVLVARSAAAAADACRQAPRAELVLEDPPVAAEAFVKSHRAAVDGAAARGLRLIPTATATQLNEGASDYLTALVWAAKLFGADAMRCDYAPAGMPELTAIAIRNRAMLAVRCEPLPVRYGGAKLTKGAAAGIRRLRTIGVDGGEVTEFDYDPDLGLRVGVVLGTKAGGRVRCELRLADPETWDGQLWDCGADAQTGVASCPREKGTASFSCDGGATAAPEVAETLRAFARLYYPDRHFPTAATPKRR